MDWQTIDTAPKHERDPGVRLGPPIVLGFAPDEENYSLPSCEGYWRPELKAGDNGRVYSAGWVSTLDPHIEPPMFHPTHWQPLPAHPPREHDDRKPGWNDPMTVQRRASIYDGALDLAAATLLFTPGEAIEVIVRRTVWGKGNSVLLAEEVSAACPCARP